MRRTGADRWVAAIALASLATACSSSSPERDCVSSGVKSGIAVAFERGILPASGQVAITACVERECRTNVTPVTATAFVPMLPRPDAERVTVTVDVLSGAADTLFQGSSLAQVHTVRAGDGDCGETVWQVAVYAHKDGHLSAAP